MQIFKAMMGEHVDHIDRDKLNKILPCKIEQCKNSSTTINLLYSPNEHTYPEHIVYLINDLKKANIKYNEKIEKFEDHLEVGRYFVPYIREELKDL